MDELAALEQLVHETATQLIDEEEVAIQKMEAKYEQCDAIDVGIVDMAAHRSQFPEEVGVVIR
jgi:hypothetical protein